MAAQAHATAPEAPAGDPRGWRRSFRNLSREHGFEPLRVEGRLPAWLSGAFYKNGPALFEIGGRAYRHWFDGDGALTAVRIADGQAQGAVRIVQSAGLLEERRRGRATFGAYGTPPSGLLPRLRALRHTKNAANTSVMMHEGELLALWEGGRPTRLDPRDLTTLGETDLGGIIPQAFSAHPHRVPQRRATFNFGVRYGRQGMLDVFALPDGGAPARMTSIPLPDLSLVHDFIATERHLVFFIPPVHLSPLPLLLGLKSLSDCLSWQPHRGTKILVVPIERPEAPLWLEAEAFYQWHFAGAYEQGDRLFVDYVRYPDFDTNAWLGSLVGETLLPARFGALHRAEIDLGARRFTSTERYGGAPEFPRIHPGRDAQPYRYVYAGDQSPEAQAALAVQDGIVKVDVPAGRAEVAPAGPHRWLGEPVFAPRPRGEAEDDGALLVLGYDAAEDRSFLAVYDARAVGDGAVARLWFDHAIPLGFHGIWEGAA